MQAIRVVDGNDSQYETIELAVYRATYAELPAVDRLVKSGVK